MISLTKEQFDCIQDNSSYEVIDEHHVKHDTTAYIFVYQDQSTGKWYQGQYACSYNYGIDDMNFPLDVEEVEKVEVTTFEWRVVKKGKK